MKLNELSPAYGSTKKRKRVGRGGKYSKTAGAGEKTITYFSYFSACFKKNLKIEYVEVTISSEESINREKALG